MSQQINRRAFLKMTTAATAGVALTSPGRSETASTDDRPVRVGVIGPGSRGTHLLKTLLAMKGVHVPAVCDINLDCLKQAQEHVVKAGQPKPTGYSDGEEAYKALLQRDDLGAVLIATPWEWHTPMAVDAMKAGKYVAVEVPCAITMQECWDLVNTHEETGVPCMMMENWSFRRDNLAVLNMIRKGLLGEIVHCHCAYSHNCIERWFWDPRGKPSWATKYLLQHNRDQYPTHPQGPVLSWMDINCGDAYAYLTSTATSPTAVNAYFTRKFRPDHPNAKRQFAQGDIVTSVVKTHKGRTIVINNDMMLPRPYDNRWLIQGTLGLYNEQRGAVSLVERSSKGHQWEPFAPYQEEFEHAWWKAIKDHAAHFGHGGTDYLELRQFLEAVRNRTQTPLDVYDSVTTTSIVPLSGESIARNSAPVECPDFTRGKWKTRKPGFALDA